MAKPSQHITPQFAQQLLAVLSRHLEGTKRLLQYLDAEKSAIEKRDYDAYYAIVENKKQTLVSIESTERERHSLLHSIGYEIDKAGFEAFVRKIPATWQTRFNDVWNNLSQNLKRCRDLNEVNGKVLLHAQLASERLLQVIKGVRPNETVYRANGRAHAGASHRSLATA